MKTIKTYINPFLFVAFLVIGLVTAFTFNHKVSAAQSTLVTEDTAATPISGQKNNLLVVVNKVDTQQAILEGVWLVIEDSSTYDFSFIALYPTNNDAGNSNIYVNPKDIVALTTLNFVTAQDIWWEHVFIVDEAALNQLLELTGGFTHEGGNITNIADMHVIPLALQPPAQSFQTQSTVLNGICSGLTNPNALSFIEKTYPLHLFTDARRAELIGYWQRIVAGGPEIQCRFFGPQ